MMYSHGIQGTAVESAPAEGALRVVYDISLLGHGLRNPMNRTGLFRVASAIATGLARRSDCLLSLVASESFETLDLCLDYVRQDARLASVPFLVPSATNVKRRLLRTLVALQQQVKDSSELKAHLRAGEYAAAVRALKLHKRLLRRSASYTAGVLEWDSVPSDWEKRSTPDIYHSPFGPLPQSSNQVTRFLTIHDLIPLVMPHLCTAPQRRLLESVLASVSPGDWVLANSQATKDSFCEYTRFDPARVFVTRWAADPELFHPCAELPRHSVVRRRYGIPSGPYFLTLSTFEPRKNLDHVIRCFSRFVRECRVRHVSIVLVGTKGWMHERIADTLAAHRALQHQIVLTGYVADEDLAPIYSGALAFVYPSLAEGFGLPPLEAMQCGTPVIVSNAWSLPEVVGDAGILVDPRDEDELCESFRWVYQDEALRSSMHVRSLARASDFTWARTVDETVAAYQAALAARYGRLCR